MGISLAPLLLLLAPCLVVATQDASFDLPRDVLTRYQCGWDCQQTLQASLPVDVAALGKDFDFDFYETSSQFPHSMPGHLLKLEAIDPKTLNVTAGTTVYRMQYTSLDHRDLRTPVTGFVAFPYSRPPQAGLPTCDDGSAAPFKLVAYGHKTSGVHRGCAPSNGPALYDHDTWKHLIDRGFAVVGTDYAGLGSSDSTYRYLNFSTHANDMFYAVEAAKKALKHTFTKEWMAVGHGEGGGAVWKLAESKLLQGYYGHYLTGYLGAVALAPLTTVVDQLLDKSTPLSVPTLSHLPHLDAGMRLFDPSYNTSFLNTTISHRMALAEKAQLCETAMTGLTMDLMSGADLVSYPGISKDKQQLLKWQSSVAPGNHRTHNPLLIMQGLDDTTAAPIMTQRAHQRACKLTPADIDLRTFAGVNHAGLPAATALEWVSWIESRFRGSPTAGVCCLKRREPFDPLNLKKPVDVVYHGFGPWGDWS